MSHKLTLVAEDSPRDPQYIFLHDLSVYDHRLPLQNRSCFVQCPGYTDPVEVPLSAEQTTHLNSYILGMSSNWRNLSVLPDGLYTITYSVAPNLEINTILYHFRTYNLEMRITQAMQRLLSHDKLNRDSAGNPQQHKEEQTLLRAEMLLSAIKFVRITDDAQYNQVLLQYQEIESMLSIIDFTHV